MKCAAVMEGQHLPLVVHQAANGCRARYDHDRWNSHTLAVWVSVLCRPFHWWHSSFAVVAAGALIVSAAVAVATAAEAAAAAPPAAAAAATCQTAQLATTAAAVVGVVQAASLCISSFHMHEVS